MNLAPTAGDMAVPADGQVMPGIPATPVDPTTGSSPIPEPNTPGGSQVPPESNEQRANMPKPAAMWRGANRMRKIANEHQAEPIQVPEDAPMVTVEGMAPRKAVLSDYDPMAWSIYKDPKHIGKRKHLVEDGLIKADQPF